MFPASSTSLEGQTILVLGGTSGIGYGVALASLHAGAAKVIIGSSSSERVQKAIDRCRQSAAKSSLRVHGTLKGVVIDAKDTHAIEKAVKDLGTINHLVFTCGDDVGQARGVNILEVDIAEMKEQDIFGVRFWGAIQAAKSAKFAPGGSVILTSGSLSQKPIPGWGLACALTSAINGITKGLAVDLAPNVRVNCIMPGLIDTELHDVMPTDVKQAIFAQVASKALLKRVGTPEDVAEAFIFCMKCGYITGQMLLIDGGMNLA